MSAPPVTLIVNPAARGGRSAEGQALDAFGALGTTVTVMRTTQAGDAGRFAAACTSDTCIYTLGGDGTVMEVVSALVGRGMPVGILPGGTGNQLARHLGIPLNVGEAVRALHRSRVVTMDLGRLQSGRYFALTAGFGLDAAMIRGASPRWKRRVGVLAYVWSGAAALPSLRPFPVDVEADGQRFQRTVSLAMVANVGALLGGRFSLGPSIAPDDGWLDLCLFAPESVAAATTLAWRLLRHDFRADPRVQFVRARTIRIAAPESVPAQADGEIIEGNVVAATAVPHAARLFAPARDD